MIELDCIFEHEGRKFEAGGAVVTPDYLVAYPAADGRLNDWHGNEIGRYTVVSSRRAVFFGRMSHWGERFYYMRAIVDGQVYSIRGFGVGMIARGKAMRRSA